MTTKKPCRSRGFTLVEMLVVIAIIGVLAAILVPTLYRVVIKARQTRIAMELSELHKAVEAYKQKYGDYPPDFTTIVAATSFTDPANRLVRHLRKACPRHNDGYNNVNMTFPTGQPATWDHDNNSSTPQVRCDPLRLDPSEALVFWLGMTKKDPRQPLNGTGQIEKIFEFDEDRLKDVDNDGWLSFIPPDGKDAPYVYFDSVMYANSDATIAALCVFKDASVTPARPVLYPYATTLKKDQAPDLTNNPPVAANKTTFQIVSAGLDGEYGDVSAVVPGNGTTYKFFPYGTNYALPAELDNISNFSDGKIFEDHVP